MDRTCNVRARGDMHTDYEIGNLKVIDHLGVLSGDIIYDTES
jgi:hypothetical protein